MVGCVLVRDGAILAEAHHQEFGGPHAEVLALQAAGDARGATAYVSLEPCRHPGKTPPCTDALVRAGVTRVVFGAKDPTPEAGGGAEALRLAGTEVVGPLFDPERARLENPAFHHVALHGTPWVALKLATSLDGRIAASPGVRTRLTGPEADREVHRLRAGCDAILVGGGTARVDDPRLTVREDVPVRRAPSRLVLDSEARLPPEAALFRDLASATVEIFVGEGAPADSVGRLEDAGARVHVVPYAPTGPGLDLGAVLGEIWGSGYRSVLCEGGAALGSSLLVAGRLARIYLFVTPHVLGERGQPAFTGPLGAAGRGWIPVGDPRIFGHDRQLVYDRPAVSEGPKHDLQPGGG
jgi:diaminohydroxyphosphoribosylaminopyrimidine deaminase/5-amino-6-(5-phosphoribosylamino)uracil reductase